MAHSPTVRCKPYFKLRSQVRRISARPVAPGAQSAQAIPWSLPALCAAYNWPSGQPGGGTIAIVELGGGWVQSDIDAFFQSLNQPVPSITDVSVDGTQNSPNQSVGSSNDADIEVALDIEASAAAYYAATGQAATIRVIGRRTSPPLSPKRCRTVARSAPSPGALTKPSGAPRPPTKWNRLPPMPLTTA